LVAVLAKVAEGVVEGAEEVVAAAVLEEALAREADLVSDLAKVAAAVEGLVAATDAYS
jgi:hypothetical protein